MENEQLQLEVAQLESLDRIDREASARLHMGPPDRAVYVTAAPISIPTPRASPTPLGVSAQRRLASYWQTVFSKIQTLRGFLTER